MTISGFEVLLDWIKPEQLSSVVIREVYQHTPSYNNGFRTILVETCRSNISSQSANPPYWEELSGIPEFTIDLLQAIVREDKSPRKGITYKCPECSSTWRVISNNVRGHANRICEHRRGTARD